jgi:hypothetical protein
MGGASSTYADSILVGKLNDRDHLKDLGINGKIIISVCSKSRTVWGMDWIVVALDMDRSWAFVNAVMNRWVL